MTLIFFLVSSAKNIKEGTGININPETESEKVIDLIDKYAENLRLNRNFECLKYQKI